MEMVDMFRSKIDKCKLFQWLDLGISSGEEIGPDGIFTKQFRGGFVPDAFSWETT
jgi:hypothetical protein